jgi:hypothetical protein
MYTSHCSRNNLVICGAVWGINAPSCVCSTCPPRMCTAIGSPSSEATCRRPHPLTMRSNPHDVALDQYDDVLSQQDGVLSQQDDVLSQQDDVLSQQGAWECIPWAIVGCGAHRLEFEQSAQDGVARKSRPHMMCYDARPRHAPFSTRTTQTRGPGGSAARCCRRRQRVLWTAVHAMGMRPDQ